jgi:hypothetical protein
MSRVNWRESESVEFKREWTDHALEDLAAFANTHGGTLYIGVEDDGHVVGASISDAAVQRLANLITSRLGIAPSIRTETIEEKPVLAIQVDVMPGIVPWNGRYLQRVDSKSCALIHRDYTDTADIQVRVCDDELSIWNPRGLPLDLSADQLRRRSTLPVRAIPCWRKPFTMLAPSSAGARAQHASSPYAASRVYWNPSSTPTATSSACAFSKTRTHLTACGAWD